ncbi:hypothetical protein H6P81_011315 [Aristolochia fimbriata]|uniref:CCHC-type domain-containing protein n=1 Tax=Aristolochia fimbriata TaxID=158543 RepID=A0AAV7ER72_ARIFI|nr:hypothetical protein H6P81_011315 [Aristolochia fimbriata]
MKMLGSLYSKHGPVPLLNLKERYWISHKRIGLTKKRNAAKALNAIFCGVSLEAFSRMSAITFAKEAWESLEIHYEGTAPVRIAKLQQLLTKFELIKIKEDETILKYDGKIRRLANEARLLGDPFPENRLVRKVLRSLNKKFSVKAIVIAKANNFDKMTLNEVIGSLCTFETEMEAGENTSPMNDQNIAFTGETSKPGFNKLYRKFSKRGNPSKYGEKKAEKFTAEQKKIQCHGCDGYGHIQAECPTIQKKKKAHNMFFLGVQEDVPPPEIPEDDFTFLKGMKDKLNHLSSINRELIVKLNESEASQKFLQIDVMKRDESLKLQEKKIEELQKELFTAQQILKKLKKGKGKLDEILSSGKTSNDKSGLGYTGSTSKRQPVFVKEGSSKQQTTVVKEEPQVKRTHKRFKKSGCYYCQDLGLIQSQCYKLFRDLKYTNKGFWRNHLKHKFIWI